MYFTCAQIYIMYSALPQPSVYECRWADMQYILIELAGCIQLDYSGETFAATSRIIFDVWYYSIRQYVRLL